MKNGITYGVLAALLLLVPDCSHPRPSIEIVESLRHPYVPVQTRASISRAEAVAVRDLVTRAVAAAPQDLRAFGATVMPASADTRIRATGFGECMLHPLISVIDCLSPAFAASPFALLSSVRRTISGALPTGYVLHQGSQYNPCWVTRVPDNFLAYYWLGPDEVHVFLYISDLRKKSAARAKGLAPGSYFSLTIQHGNRIRIER